MQQGQRARSARPPEVSTAFAACRAPLISAGIFSCFVNLLMLTGPLFMLQIYDRVLASRSVPTLLALIIIVVALYGFYGFLEYVRARLLVRIGRRVEERLRERGFNAVAAHALRRTPGIGSQPISDLQTIRTFVSGQGPFAFLDMPWVPVYLAVIFMMHWVLGVASALAALAIFILALSTEFVTRKP